MHAPGRYVASLLSISGDMVHCATQQRCHVRIHCKLNAAHQGTA